MKTTYRNKVMAFVLVLMMCFVNCVPVSAGVAGDFEYEIMGDGTIEITDYLGTSNELKIPATIDGYKVTSIGRSAFYECTSLESIEIPEEVTSIGNYAFNNCASLVSIEIPEGVTSIGDYAFGYCTSLVSIDLPSSLTSIGRGTFVYCKSLTNISVATGSKTFCSLNGVLYDKAMTKIIKYPARKTDIKYRIADGITYIEDNSFELCSTLQNIEIPEGVTSIGSYAFRECTSLVSIEIPEEVTSIGDYAFGYCTSLESIEIPEEVTSIGNYAFCSCISLESIEVPEGVTSIGFTAFSGCSSLVSVEIPEGVTSIGSWAFDDCPQLWHVVYRGTESQWNGIEVSSYGNNALLSAKRHYASDGEEVIEKIVTVSCTEAGEMSYKCLECNETKTVATYSEPLGHNIVDDVCLRCKKTSTQLTAEELAVTKVDAKAELDTYKNPDDYRDAQKTEMANAITIGKNEIDACTVIDDVLTALANTKAVIDAIKTDAEYDLEEAIVAAKEELDQYKNADDYRDAEKESLADAIEEAKAALDAADSIDEVNSLLADAKTSMDEIKTDEQLKAEEEANVMPTPTVDATKVPTTGDYQYNIKNDGTIEITKYTGNESVIQIPNEIDGYTVTSIGDSAFANNKTLINVFLPENLQKVGQHAFDSCLSLVNVGINTNIKSIEDYAFYNCPALNMVTLPESITRIGKYAFGYDNTNKAILGFFITGYSGTVAETYATENGLTFTSVGESSGATTKKVTLKFTKKSVKIKRGKKMTLKVKLTGAKKATFTTSKKKVVKIVKKKARKVVIKGLRKGKAVITAKAAGKKAKCKVTVR